MELKSTLRVFNETDIPYGPGRVQGQTRKRLAGSAEHPSERITVVIASFKPGTLEHLHWHMIEAFHYVISGRAIVKDIEGRTHDVGPGSIVYAPPGIEGSHEWDIKEELVLIAFRATNDPERNLQLTVDPSTKESKITFIDLVEDILAAGTVSLKKSLY